MHKAQRAQKNSDVHIQRRLGEFLRKKYIDPDQFKYQSLLDTPWSSKKRVFNVYKNTDATNFKVVQQVCDTVWQYLEAMSSKGPLILAFGGG